MATATTYSYAQLEQLWIQNGGPAAAAPIAAAVALAESAGNSGAVNATDNNGTQTSWGLWQVSNGTHNQPVPNILDPNVNAAAAVAKYKGAGNTFTPWGTYTSGAYLPHVSNSTPPSSTGVPASAVTTAATGGAGAPVPGCMLGPPSFSFAGFTIGGGCWLTKSEARAVIGGLLMFNAGLIVLPGLIILVAAGFRGSGAPAALAGAAGPLQSAPGYGTVIRAARRQPAPPARTRAPARA